MLKTYIFQRFVHGYPLDAVVVTMGSKLPASLINAVFAMIVAPILYAAIAPALQPPGVFWKSSANNRRKTTSRTQKNPACGFLDVHEANAVSR